MGTATNKEQRQGTNTNVPAPKRGIQTTAEWSQQGMHKQQIT
jgi:hypothetical protein